jgi:hypothetical protein
MAKADMGAACVYVLDRRFLGAVSSGRESTQVHLKRRSILLLGPFGSTRTYVPSLEIYSKHWLHDPNSSLSREAMRSEQ